MENGSSAEKSICLHQQFPFGVVVSLHPSDLIRRDKPAKTRSLSFSVCLCIVQGVCEIFICFILYIFIEDLILIVWEICIFDVYQRSDLFNVIESFGVSILKISFELNVIYIFFYICKLIIYYYLFIKYKLNPAKVALPVYIII